MAKKSHKRAAKYSELSKSRRKRQLTRPGPQSQVVATPKAHEADATGTKKTPAPQRVPKTQPNIRLTIPDYKYVAVIKQLLNKTSKRDNISID